MKRILSVLALLSSLGAYSQLPDLNMPLVCTKFTADPAPVVVNDTVYLYTTHDEDNAEGFAMRDWLLYTSTDMVNWQDRGAVASLKDFKWYDGDNGAWAEQVVFRDGKWYMYCPIHGHGIGVLVADSPYGLLKTPSESHLSGRRNIGMISIRPSGSTMTARHTCIGEIPACIVSSLTPIWCRIREK